MLPQTRQKLRLFSFVAIGIGCLLMLTLWMFAEPKILVAGTDIPTFWDVLVGPTQADDAVQWQLLDLELSWQFFANLLRATLFLTVCTAALCLVVVYNDIRLTKK
jgi:hypothetical protein